ncbi:hypothetical protein J4207_04835 [Candidatus Woesearchaeota archaeon]|nr:hypothetical protein [Candidatus Woesearchaeota archaeon]
MDVSIKIPQEDLVLIEDLKLHLRKLGIVVSKKQLIGESIKLAAEREDVLLQRIKRKDNTKELTERFLKNEASFDFGKHWMEEIDTTL